jgi:hypothetical protein
MAGVVTAHHGGTGAAAAGGLTRPAGQDAARSDMPAAVPVRRQERPDCADRDWRRRGPTCQRRHFSSAHTWPTAWPRMAQPVTNVTHEPRTCVKISSSGRAVPRDSGDGTACGCSEAPGCARPCRGASIRHRARLGGTTRVAVAADRPPCASLCGWRWRPRTMGAIEQPGARAQGSGPRTGETRRLTACAPCGQRPLVGSLTCLACHVLLACACSVLTCAVFPARSNCGSMHVSEHGATR